MRFKLIGRGEEHPRRGFPDRPTIGTPSPAKTGDFLPGGDNYGRNAVHIDSREVCDEVFLLFCESIEIPCKSG
jgi:hypothetical protein